MTDRKAEGLPSAPWRASAAYLYTLDLDSPALAWEYLRRHPQYQADWARRAASLKRWGCDSAEDPRLDAREARPYWITAADELLHVRASRAHGASTRPTFDLWRVPGRKRLALGGSGFTLLTEVSAQRLRMSLADDLSHGAVYACTVPLGSGLRGQLDVFNAQARALQGDAPAEDSTRTVTRAALLHLRALQALDGAQAGASHRDIAQALFSLEAMVRWHADGELRAQVRHLLRRAEAYMNGGYLSLAGIQRAAAESPGDEPMR